MEDQIGCTVDYTAGRNRYMSYLLSLAIHSFKGKRVAQSSANGGRRVRAAGRNPLSKKANAFFDSLTRALPVW